jgi:hypothetical protein
MTTFQKKLQKDRTNEETANAGLKWDIEDDKYLLESASNKVSVSEIAKTLKRTEGSIKTRIIINILSKCDDNRTNLDSLCNQYNIDIKDVEVYLQKKDLREKKKTQRIQKNNSSFTSEERVEILQALTLMDKKLNNLDDKLSTILKKV